MEGPVKGTCLCGGVEFEVRDAPRRLYQCHCSLCRKQSGSAANAAFLIRRTQLQWLAGETLIRSFALPTGFRSDFCSRCGSPVPNQVRGSSWAWVPAGLLEEPGDLEIVAHLHVGSKASWEPAPTTGSCHRSMPEFAALMALLKPDEDDRDR